MRLEFTLTGLVPRVPQSVVPPPLSPCQVHTCRCRHSQLLPCAYRLVRVTGQTYSTRRALCSRVVLGAVPVTLAGLAARPSAVTGSGPIKSRSGLGNVNPTCVSCVREPWLGPRRWDGVMNRLCEGCVSLRQGH